MKLFAVVANVWLGPGTPVYGIIREESEIKAIEAFMTPSLSPFSLPEPINKFWFLHRIPKTDDFTAKVIGIEDRWPDTFAEDLRDPLVNNGQVLTKDQNLCRLFMTDRVVVRTFSDGGAISTAMFGLRLLLGKLLRHIADILDNKYVEPKPTE